jgi:hypothetical protein
VDNGPTPRLVLTRSVTGAGIVTVATEGELDLSTVDQFGLAIDLAIARPGREDG